MNTLTFTITQLQNIIIIIPILSIGVIQAEGNFLKVTLSKGQPKFECFQACVLSTTPHCLHQAFACIF